MKPRKWQLGFEDIKRGLAVMLSVLNEKSQVTVLGRDHMYKAVFFLVGFGLMLGLAAPTSAINFSATLLASYEPSETNDLTVTSPDSGMTITWPIQGGVNDVPPATKGCHVLKLDWINETDHKVQVRHDWNDLTFDLAGADFIHADVYVATESAMPDIMGIWDNDWKYKWISADCVPRRTNEWRTISFGVSALNEPNLDHIEALVFEDMPGDDGTVHIDNLRLGPAACNCLRKIKFSGYWWSVLQSEWPMGAGPNYFTDSPNDIWVDPNGHLHMSIVYRDSNWYCSEAIGNANFGYGTYVFTVRDEVNSLDPNIVLGLFIYDVPDEHGNHREIDVEITRWGNPNDPNNAQFVVQPWDHPNNISRFRIDDAKPVTHEIMWSRNRIDFCSYRGDYAANPQPEDLIHCWSYTGEDIPEAGFENPRINFYLMGGDPPLYGQGAEVVIKEFRYLPPGDLDRDGDVDANDLDWFVGYWLDTCSISLNGLGGELVCGGSDLDDSENVDFADYAILAQHWLEGTANKGCGFCGDGICSQGEGPASCPEDCGGPLWPTCWDCPTQCRGNANCDGIVDEGDLPPPIAIGTIYPNLWYDPCFDFDRNGSVDVEDLSIWAINSMLNPPPTDCPPGGIWPPNP